MRQTSVSFLRFPNKMRSSKKLVSQFFKKSLEQQTSGVQKKCVDQDSIEEEEPESVRSEEMVNSGE